MKMDSDHERRVLATFTQARRKHGGLTPASLEAQLGVPSGTIRAVEAGLTVSKWKRAKLRQWNGLSRGEEGRRPDREAETTHA